MDPPPPYEERPPPPPLPPRSSSSTTTTGPNPGPEASSVTVSGPDPDSQPQPQTRSHLRPYTDDRKQPASSIYPSASNHAHDPRTSSTQSLVSPAPSDEARKALRTLLVVYIHGFYGNDQSFQSFPAHVHAALRGALADSHAIHSKIYPRYKTYRAIELARDKFSAWLEPHESPTTDVILVGHSMGGLLAADVVLMPNKDPTRNYPFKHRILGTISLDSPFLGMHPGIVVSGISSLFQKAPDAPTPVASPSPSPAPSSTHDLTASIDSQINSTTSLTSNTATTPTSPSAPAARQSTDPFYDPPFFNDDPFREQPFMKRVMHFASKHKAEGIFSAMGNHILSHLEYGGCLADYPGLVSRYRKVRNLDDVDEYKAVTEGHPQGAFARVRFVNYYTLSSGRPKSPKQTRGGSHSSNVLTPASTNTTGLQTETSSLSLAQTESTMSKSSNVEEKDKSDNASTASFDTARGESKASQEVDREQSEAGRQEGLPDIRPLAMQELDPTPIEEEEPSSEPLPTTETTDAAKEQDATIQSTSEPTQPSATDDPDLPPIPSPPAEPTLPDPTQYTDKATRKQIEKEVKVIQKNHEAALKAHEKAVRAREKHLEKRRKQADKDAADARKQQEKKEKKEREKLDKELKKAQQQQEKDAKKAAAAASAAASNDGEEEAGDGNDDEQQRKNKKLRKFCALPGKIDGAMDPTWVSVYMDGVDEVGAHCGLFFAGEHYDKLVGDVSTRMVSWVQDDMSKRAILET